MKYKDYYEVLGVPKNAPEKDIKSAYRKLARKWHPDANPSDAKKAEERFKEISEAYEVVGDSDKRKKYDALGSNWEQAQAQAEAQRRYRDAQAQAHSRQYRPSGSGDPFAGSSSGGGSGFSDFFDSFFSAGGGAPGRRSAQFAQRGADLDAALELTLAEAYAGGSKSVSLQIEDACPRCSGAGVVNNTICPQCHGTSRTIASKRLDVSVPKGVRDGQRIRLAGQGGRGAGGGANGDLFLDVTVKADTTFERRGDDLYVDLPVSVYELVLGGSVRVPTMSGNLDVTIPPGTQSNKFLKLGGKGMPKVRGGGAGDQYVRLIGMLPTDLSPRERELYAQLAALRLAKA
ncbi:MAG: molecular chaperone DnaJ [Vulcanimicrobiaceae bacterium]